MAQTESTAAGRSGGQAKRQHKTAGCDAEALRRFIRVRGQAYLADPNVTSIGIGYKITDGKQTDLLSLQFTVHAKLPPEELLPSELLPDSIDVDEVAVPTDVLERSYAPSYVLVPETAPSERTRRADPVVPGISIGNTKTSAGTLGAIVYDRTDGTPYALSNWHVLHGPGADIGVTVVQPGTYDDNRAGANDLGQLVRSHLGAAGDCAIASMTKRRFDANVLELDLAPDSIGDAELGDKVIKSGRTSGVTHGVVKRVDVLTKIDYGEGIGEQNIGGFEIGPDPAHADEVQISEGGDSGSIWLFRSANGRTSRTMAGLHFAGDAGTGQEAAMACLPRSVFEKLGVSLDPKAYQQAHPEDAGTHAARGYDTGFLSSEVPEPTLSAELEKDTAPVKSGGALVRRTHFTLTMSSSRRLARWVAWNIDGTSMKKLSRSKMKFTLDPEIAPEHQWGDELYKDNDLDRGHLARRADLTWGPDPEAAAANKDSFYFTNISPQMNSFNQSTRGGLWGRLEDAVYAEVDVDNLRVSAFAGPVLGDDDKEYRGARIPREFWKILAYEENGTLKAKAFLLTQDLSRLETLDLSEFRTYQVTLKTLTDRTGVHFPQVLGAGEGLAAEALSTPRLVQKPSDIMW